MIIIVIIHCLIVSEEINTYYAIKLPLLLLFAFFKLTYLLLPSTKLTFYFYAKRKQFHYKINRQHGLYTIL